MTISFTLRFAAAIVLPVILSALPAKAQVIDQITTFASGTAVKATAPDSITIGNGSVWVEYGNGVKSDGTGDPSTIVQYSMAGAVQHTYSIAGSADGLKINPADGNVWALQNQDGNSTLTIINPASGIVAGSPMPYAEKSAARGYDDVVFRNGQTFLSYTNPTAATDATIQLLTSGSNPLAVTTVMTMGATATNIATGKAGPLPAKDPDSLKLTPQGDLMLTGGDDGQLIIVHNPAAADQSVSFLQLTDAAGNPVKGLDDAVYVTAEKGTFYLADTKNNRVLAIQASGLKIGSLFASVGSLNVLGSVDPTTGVVTSFGAGVGLANAPHGLEFVPAAP